MTFRSILFADAEVSPAAGAAPGAAPRPALGPAEPGSSSSPGGRPERWQSPVAEAEERPPAFFTDLSLDRVLAAMTAGYDEYQLEEFFFISLRDEALVRYRHEVLRDLETEAVRGAVDEFVAAMRTVRDDLALAEKLRHLYQRDRWFLEAVQVYVEAVRRLAEQLAAVPLASQGLLALRGYLVDYLDTSAFSELAAAVQALRTSLAQVQYTVHIKESRVRVSRFAGEADYAAEVAATFAKFRQGSVRDYRVQFPEWAEMNQVEVRILELVARLFPTVFEELTAFAATQRDFLDPTIVAFDREIHFFLAYLEYIKPLRAAGLSFCYPEVSAQAKDVWARDAFDLALADKLVAEHTPVICNDFSLSGRERVLVVSGPNQGGKTTFARMFGQLHYLASLGLPVPGTAARLFLADRVFTHFEREENVATLRGKLDDELVRMRDILREATSQSVIIINEIFAGTTLKDALFLSSHVLRAIIALDALAVCVTFLDELSSLGESTVSMVATVVPDDPAQRTYKIVRKPPDGLAYAWAIAEKYGLTYERLKERMLS